MPSTDLVVIDPPIPEHPNLRPFEPGYDYRRRPGRGRPSLLDDPEMVDLFARAVAEGLTNKQLSETFHIGERTARDHKKDPRVKAAAFKYAQDRVLLITRKTDAEIERRLEKTADMDVIELLKVRKEFLGGAFRAQTEGGKADDRTITDAMDSLEGDPELAAKLLDLLGGRAPKAEAE